MAVLIFVDPYPNDQQFYSFLLGSAQQEKALKTLEKAKAKAMEKASQKLSQALEAHQESKAAVAEEWDPWLAMHYVPQ
eukprot:s922_g24.t1